MSAPARIMGSCPGIRSSRPSKRHPPSGPSKTRPDNTGASSYVAPSTAPATGANTAACSSGGRRRCEPGASTCTPHTCAPTAQAAQGRAEGSRHPHGPGSTSPSPGRSTVSSSTRCPHPRHSYPPPVTYKTVPQSGHDGSPGMLSTSIQDRLRGGCALTIGCWIRCRRPRGPDACMRRAPRFLSFIRCFPICGE